MAMIKCDECETSISDKAQACVSCGAPVLSEAQKKQNEMGYTDPKTGQPRLPYKWEVERDFKEGIARGEVKLNEVVAEKGKKSVAAALLLTFFLGPFGLCYVNVTLGVILGVLWALSIPFTLGVLTVIPWLAGIIFAAIDVEKHNNGEKVSFESVH